MADTEDDDGDYSTDDNDFAQIILDLSDWYLWGLEDYQLWLGRTSNLKIFADAQKTSLSGGTPSGDWYYWTISNGSITLPNEISNNNIGKVYVEGVGITTTEDEVYWQLRKSDGTTVIAVDTVEINVEKIVWPSNETEAADINDTENWAANGSEDWNGFELTAGWSISKSLCQIINGQSSTIRTGYPEEISTGRWEAKNDVTNATIDIKHALGLGAEEAIDCYRVTVDYSFENGPHSQGNYVDIQGTRYKLSIAARNGASFAAAGGQVSGCEMGREMELVGVWIRSMWSRDWGATGEEDRRCGRDRR